MEHITWFDESGDVLESGEGANTAIIQILDGDQIVSEKFYHVGEKVQLPNEEGESPEELKIPPVPDQKPVPEAKPLE